MNKLAVFLQKFAMEYVIKYLKNNKAEVIKAANAKVNVPILNEKQEAKLLSDFFDKFMLALDKFSDKVK